MPFWTYKVYMITSKHDFVSKVISARWRSNKVTNPRLLVTLTTAVQPVMEVVRVLIHGESFG